MRAPAFVLASALAAIAVLPAYGDQTVIFDYDTARDRFFWPQLYAGGGSTAYCNHAFGDEQELWRAGSTRARSGELLSVEHAYPADWTAEALDCPNRKECSLPRYGHADADLHNLWPALRRINSSRGELPFGEIPGEQSRRFEDLPCCDYERSSGSDAVVEPRNARKAELARSILYMNREYGLPVDPRMMRTMREWQCRDAPSRHERYRNDVIDAIQHTRNPFIETLDIVDCNQISSAVGSIDAVHAVGAYDCTAPNTRQPLSASASCRICRTSVLEKAGLTVNQCGEEGTGCVCDAGGCQWVC